MKKQRMVPVLAAVLVMALSAAVEGQQLERLSYNNPGLEVDLGVGLWAWPLPMDYDEDGRTDLVVVCTDKPYNGVYLFENPGEPGEETGLPVFRKARRLGDAVDNVSISYVKGEPFITSPGKWYPRFRETAFEDPEPVHAPATPEKFGLQGRIRANQWKLVDYNGNGVKDLMVGVGSWEDYGWDDAYDSTGQWTRGPLHGYVYLLENQGTNEKPRYADPLKLQTTDGAPVDVFGRPSPNFADFTGDGLPDLICGEFRDGFTFFENVGSREHPLFAPGRFLTNGDRRIRMDLCMITPVVFDFTRDGWPDLIVGDEDGRVALVEHTGRMVDGMPLFLSPRYFRQEADNLKFGALATPVGFDWNGDGREDILSGNTAGQIAFFENLGGHPTRWAAPELLEGGGEEIRIMAGPNGSIQGPAEAKWGYTTFSVADWNNSGLPDLIVNSIWGKIVWFENVGTPLRPELKAAKPVKVRWKGKVPRPEWNWWTPEGNALVTQWRTTPVAVDWTGNGLTDLVMLDHEGYLALFRREKREEGLVLLPGERIFRLAGEQNPLRLNENRAGGSGRRKIAIADFDGDGRKDLLVNSQNATLFKNLGEKEGVTVLENRGVVDQRKISGHSSSPAVIDLSGNEIPSLLVGAEDGHFYFRENPYRQKFE